MTRLIFFGDLSASGFGSVTNDLGRAMLEIGYDVRFLSQNDVGQLPEPFASRTFQLTREMAAAAKGVQAALAEGAPERISISWMDLMGQVTAILEGGSWPDGWQAEAGIILGDYWGVHSLVMQTPETVAAFQRIPTLHYVPIEGVDLPPSWARLWQVIHPVAMTEFGAAQLATILPTTPPFVYHGVDTETFRPFDHHPYVVRGKRLRSRADARKMLNLPERARIVLRTDRHMPRKRYASLLRAMAPVMMTRPDVLLLIHCDVVDEGGHMLDQLSKFPANMQARVLLTDGRARGAAPGSPKVEREYLTAMYNAADVYVSPSAEGFGLTIAEAMACGIPAVGMDYSAVTEVIGDGGLLAPVNHLIDNEYDHAWAAVDEVKFGEQVAKLLDNPTLRRAIGRQARTHVVKEFSWAKAALQFSALIREKLATKELVAA